MAKKKEQEQGSRTKIIKVYALDPRYRKVPYPAVAAEDTRHNTFITGQQYQPGIKEPFLTVPEMTGEVALSAEKAEQFPFIVNPLHRVQILHGGAFNLSTDAEGNYTHPKDAAILKFIRLQDFVAPTKSEYRKGKHYFYIDDREKEAEINVTKIDQEFAAMKLIYENTSFKKMRELGLLLQYYLKDFKIEFDNWTSTMIKDRLLRAAKESPEEVLRCSMKSAENDLYVLKLSLHKIINRKSDGFYSGNDFLGSTPKEVYAFIQHKENEALASRCSSALTKAEEDSNE